MGHEESEEPLLTVSVDLPPESSDALDGPRPEEVGNAKTLQQALYRNPREAIKWLEKEGVKKLGTFRVQSTKTANLRSDPAAMSTIGTDDKDFDWEDAWRNRLDAPEPPLSGPEWSPITEVDAFVVNIPNAAGADDEGIINPLIKRYNDNICGIKVFAYPATKAVLHYKWDTWARRYLTMEMAVYLVWLITFQAFILLLQDEDMHMSLSEVAHNPRGIATIVLECVSYAAMMPFLYMEYRTIVEYWDDWLNAWNAIDVLVYSLQTVILIMHLGRLQLDSNAFSIVCAIQVLLLWVRVQYFARVLQPTKNPFMDTLRAVIHEERYFMFLLILLVIAFANSFNILFRKDQAEKEDFRTIWSSWVTLFTVMMSGYELPTYSKSHNPVFATILLVIFVFIMCVVLLNCLIALMSDAAAKVSDREGWQFQLSRALIIDELETTLPDFFRKASGKTWYPQYVHFIVVNHDYESVKMLDLGMPAEDVKEENESDESESEASGSGSPPKNGGKKEIKEKALADEIDGLKEELSDAKQQIARLMEIQEAIARQTLSRSTIKSLFDS